jgi:hypothetical protein
MRYIKLAQTTTANKISALQLLRGRLQVWHKFLSTPKAAARDRRKFFEGESNTCLDEAKCSLISE